MKNTLTCIFAILLFSPLLQASVKYFPSKIDYWKDAKPEAKKVHKKQKTEELSQKPTPTKKDPENKKEPFNWDKHLDPENTEEFFKEGDHMPPPAFIELIKNPSDGNIKNWFKLIDRKNQLLQRLQLRVKQYLAKNDKKLKPLEKKDIFEKAQKIKKFDPDAKRYRFRMYFESSCPHCKRMLSELKSIQNKGFFVEIRQIDDNTKYSYSLPFPISKATAQELKEKNINSWPVLFIGDSKKKVLYRLNGFQTEEQIFEALSTNFN